LRTIGRNGKSALSVDDLTALYRNCPLGAKSGHRGHMRLPTLKLETDGDVDNVKA
jgi:hypothetical protein